MTEPITTAFTILYPLIKLGLKAAEKPGLSLDDVDAGVGLHKAVKALKALGSKASSERKTPIEELVELRVKLITTAFMKAYHRHMPFSAARVSYPDENGHRDKH